VTIRVGQPSAIVLASPIRLDDSGPLFTQRSEGDFDHASVEKSARLGAEISRVARERGVLFADAGQCRAGRW
jgi:hypothetical protein